MSGEGKGDPYPSYDSVEEEMRDYHARLNALKVDDRLQPWEPAYLIAREDNERLVRINIHERQKGRLAQAEPNRESEPQPEPKTEPQIEPERGAEQNPAQATQPERENGRTLTFFEDRAPRSNYTSLKLEHANGNQKDEPEQDQEPEQQPEQEQPQKPERTLSFFEDRNMPEPGRSR